MQVKSTSEGEYVTFEGEFKLDLINSNNVNIIVKGSLLMIKEKEMKIEREKPSD
ncbi:hypothetical protein Hdeb2414_s0010g00345691 [Helianthus debilis subsp. tardiflorus]